MKEITPELYNDYFQDIFNWFHDNVHVGADAYRYDVINLKDTHHRIVDIVNESSGKVHFRVLLRATFEDVEKGYVPQKDYRDINWLFNTSSNAELTNISGFQVCYVQLKPTGKPFHGILYTYSPHDEKYHTFKLGK